MVTLKFVQAVLIVNVGKIAEELDRRSKNEYVSPYLQAVIYAPMSGREGDTMKFLRRAKEEDDPRLNWANVDSRFKKWRDRPEFKKLLEEAGLLHTQMARTQ